MTPNECLTEVSSCILNFDAVGGIWGTTRLPRTIYPANFSNLQTSRATPLKKFLVFEFYIFIFNYRIYLVYSILAFLWKNLLGIFDSGVFVGFLILLCVDYCCFHNKPFNWNWATVWSKKITKNITDCTTMQNASHQQCHQISRKTDHSFTRYACLKF